MTRYPNPFAAFVGSIAKAFATLGDRDNAGWRRAHTVVLPRSRAGHRSTAATPQAKASSTSAGAEQGANPVERSEIMQPRRHTDAR